MGEWTVETRMLSALRRQPPDRVPVVLYLNPYGDAWETKEPTYAPVLDACREYADVIHLWYFPGGFLHTATPLDVTQHERPGGITEHVLQTPAGPLTLLTRPDWRGGGTVKRWLTTPADVERALSLPYVPARPDLAPFHRTRAAAAGRWIMHAVFPDPVCIADMIDETQLALWTLEERPLLRRLLDTCQARILDQLRYCLEGGVGPVYYFNGPEYALPPLMAPRDFDEFVVGYDRALIELVHRYPGNYVVVHSHGRVGRFLERFAGLGLDGLNVLEPPPIGDCVLADAKRRIGDRVCLIGNIQYDDLARGTPAQIERLVADAIAAGAPGGGFILSPCASPYERPLPARAAANLVHYLKCAHRFGRY